ncbi:hypothetical protein WMF38_06070 [Sorangium sp. So ce118]
MLGDLLDEPRAQRLEVRDGPDGHGDGAGNIDVDRHHLADVIELGLDERSTEIGRG